MHEADASTATNPAQHARQGSRFTGAKSFDLNRKWVSILTRYRLASRKHFSNFGKMVYVYDRSRFQHDTMVGLAGGSNDDGRFKVSVLPPQAPL